MGRGGARIGSGRKPMQYNIENKRYIERIAFTANKKLASEIERIALKPELDARELQTLVTLHLKHTPDPPKEPEKNEAMEVLRSMAVEGAREFARIKAQSTQSVHAQVLKDITPQEQPKPIQDNNFDHIDSNDYPPSGDC